MLRVTWVVDMIHRGWAVGRHAWGDHPLSECDPPLVRHRLDDDPRLQRATRCLWVPHEGNRQDMTSSPAL